MLQDVDLQYVNGVPTFGGPAAATALAATGLTGATAATRYAGATASGSPASGTFAVGDYVTDQTGVLYLRNREDADRLRDTLASARRLVVVGGGWIGLEAAAAAAVTGHSEPFDTNDHT